MPFTIFNRMLMQADRNLAREFRGLEDAVAKLEETVGRKQSDQMPVPQPSLSERLSSMSSRMKDMTRELEDRRLDHVAAEEESKQMEREIRDLKRQVRELSETSRELQKVKINLSDTRNILQSCQKEQTGIKEELEDVRSDVQEEGKARMRLIEDIIRLRDHLEFYTENAENEHMGQMVKLLNGLYKETAAILNSNGVEVIHREDEFSPEDQEVVSVVQTDAPGLNDRVSGTFSDGYRMGGRLLRAQKVMLYSYKNRVTSDTATE